MSRAVNRCVFYRRYLKTSHLLQPLVCITLSQRTLFYQKKYNWKEEFRFALYRNYPKTVKGVMHEVQRRAKKNIFYYQIFDDVEAKHFGPNLAAARLFMLLDGRVKFKHDPRWLTKDKNDKLPLPQEFREGYIVEGVDLKESKIMLPGLDYLNNLDELVYLNISKTEYTTDWFLKIISDFCPQLEYLDISGCELLTSAGLECLHTMKNLKVVDVTDCVNVKGGDFVYSQLLEFLPDLKLIGLSTLPEAGENVREFEEENSRFLKLGEDASGKDRKVHVRFDLFRQSSDNSEGENLNKDTEEGEGNRESSRNKSEQSSVGSAESEKVVVS